MAKGIELARLFHQQRHVVIGADVDGLACGRVSRAIRTFYHIPAPASDLSTQTGEPSEYAKALLRIVETENIDLWVSVSGVGSALQDSLAKQVIEQRTKAKAIQFDSQHVKILDDKDAFINHVRKLGLKVPDSRRIDNKEELISFLRSRGSLSWKPETTLYLIKPVGVNDAARLDMPLLPLSTEKETLARIGALNSTKVSSFVAQEFIQGDEYCTHSLVIRGRVKAFVACQSASVLMHYAALPPDSTLSQSMRRFTTAVAAHAGQGFTGHLSFDFMVKPGAGSSSGKEADQIYPIECNPRVHTAVVLFRSTRQLVDRYLSVLEPDVDADVDADDDILYPQHVQRYYWVGQDLVEQVFCPSLFNGTWGAGSAVGAATGGWLAETLGWRWEFGIQVPPLLLVFGASFAAIPDNVGLWGKPARTALQALREFDLVGSGLSTATTTALILALNLGGNILPWSHPIVVASMVVFAFSFPAFLWAESRTAKPIMPLHLVTKMPHANLIFGSFLASLLFNAVLFNMQVPLYFQAVLLTSATTSGLRLVVPSVASSVAGIFTGFLITRTRRLRWPLLVGSILTAIGNLVLVLLRRGLAAPLYGLALLPASLGAGFQLPGSFMALLVASPQPEHAVVTSTVLLWRSLGSVLGVAASSLVLQAGLLHHLRRNVHGDRRDDVIASVRRSVEVVARLEEPYREQVILSYEAALRLTFMLTSALALVSFVLMVPIKLKRLPAQK
ncbi:hypothetical protein MY1884_002267 [Beauveria asiatica]